MVVRKNNNKKFTVMEGNRRLAACLILKMMTEQEIKLICINNILINLLQFHGCPKIDPVPAIVFEDDDGVDKKSLISYLGVRHIVSTKDWDSYAKAA